MGVLAFYIHVENTCITVYFQQRWVGGGGGGGMAHETMLTPPVRCQ